MEATITVALFIVLLPCAGLLAFLGLLTLVDGTPGPPTRYSRLKFACAFGAPVAAVSIYVAALIGAIGYGRYSYLFPICGFVALVGCGAILIPAAQRFSGKHHAMESTRRSLFS